MRMILAITMATLFSCNTNSKQHQPGDDTVTLATIHRDTAMTGTDAHYCWTTELDAKAGIQLKRLRPINNDSVTIDNLLALMNTTYPEVQMRMMKQSGDTLFIKIPNSRFLTQQMGTSGAEAFIAEATYNLTEIKGINAVHFDFKEGDHAQPGTFSRTDFVQYQ
ncbi:MAG: hypothetical protein JST86_01615 [Bacteroidetes bacterium]|nr:hypothetical protein [Bacteroidota bacterium]